MIATTRNGLGSKDTNGMVRGAKLQTEHGTALRGAARCGTKGGVKGRLEVARRREEEERARERERHEEDGEVAIYASESRLLSRFQG